MFTAYAEKRTLSYAFVLLAKTSTKIAAGNYDNAATQHSLEPSSYLMWIQIWLDRRLIAPLETPIYPKAISECLISQLQGEKNQGYKTHKSI